MPPPDRCHLQTAPGNKKAPAARADRVLFGALLQSGAERFEVSPQQVALWSSSFMNDRMEVLDAEGYRAVIAVVEDAFSDHLPKDWLVNPDFGGAWEASTFLADLLFALRRRAGLALLIEPGELKLDSLPPELRSLVQNIVKCITWEDVALPVPVGAIRGASVGVLREVLESDLFRRYSDTHLRLEAAAHDRRPLLQELQERAAATVAGFRDRIDLGKSALGLLPTVADAIGRSSKGPDSLARLSGALGDSTLWRDRRIVIYRCAPIVRKLVLDTMVSIGAQT